MRVYVAIVPNAPVVAAPAYVPGTFVTLVSGPHTEDLRRGFNGLNHLNL
jgi:hypothetical protein